MITVDTDFPPEIETWLLSLSKDECSDDIDLLIEQFAKLQGDGTFLDHKEISDISSKALVEEFRRGGYTKMFSKKMRAAVDGKTILRGFPLRQSAVYTEVNAADRKKVGYRFSIANYAETGRGYVYMCRHGIPFPNPFFFTGHFFDRVIERSLNSTDHAARMTVVFRLLRQLDKRLMSSGNFLTICPKTSRAFMSALGGLCLGVYKPYEDLPGLGFGSECFYTNQSSFMNPPSERLVFFFRTFVSKDMLSKEQLYIYNKLQPVT